MQLVADHCTVEQVPEDKAEHATECTDQCAEA